LQEKNTSRDHFRLGSLPLRRRAASLTRSEPSAARVGSTEPLLARRGRRAGRRRSPPVAPRWPGGGADGRPHRSATRKFSPTVPEHARPRRGGRSAAPITLAEVVESGVGVTFLLRWLDGPV